MSVAGAPYPRRVSTAFTSQSAREWRTSVPSDRWWVPVHIVGIFACLMAVSPARDAPLVVGGLIAANILIWFWPALGVAVAVGLACAMPFVTDEAWGRVAVGGFAVAALVALAYRARGQFQQLRIIEETTYTQAVPHGPRELGPWRWRRALTATGAVASILLAAFSARSLLDHPAQLPWLTILVPPLLALGVALARLVVAPYARPNRWAGTEVEAQVWPHGSVVLRAIGDQEPFATYVASLPAAMADGTPDASAVTPAPPPPPLPTPYTLPDSWQTARPVPDPPRATVQPAPQPVPTTGRTWVRADLVGDVRDGGWAAAVVDGTTLAPISPLHGFDDSPSLSRRFHESRQQEPALERFKTTAAMILVGFAMLSVGFMLARDEWPVATGSAIEGRITITDRDCDDDDDCTASGRFVSDSGTLVLEDIEFDRDREIGTTHRALLHDGIDGTSAESPGSRDFALSGMLSGAGATVLGLWLMGHLSGRRRRGQHRSQRS